MPISTPSDSIGDYNGDVSHFRHVYEYLFAPAIRKLDYEPIDPASQGGELIHADIISNLEKADLVLCDMSTLNANVFFELGIRTALDKPVALVVDSITKNLPFDTNIINRLEYNPDLSPWHLTDEVDKLYNHLLKTVQKSEGRNGLWKYFGLTVTGDFQEQSEGVGEKLSLILRVLEEKEFREIDQSMINSQKPEEIVFEYAEQMINKNGALIQNHNFDGETLEIDCGQFVVPSEVVTEIKAFARKLSVKAKVVGQYVQY